MCTDQHLQVSFTSEDIWRYLKNSLENYAVQSLETFEVLRFFLPQDPHPPFYALPLARRKVLICFMGPSLRWLSVRCISWSSAWKRDVSGGGRATVAFMPEELKWMTVRVVDPGLCCCESLSFEECWWRQDFNPDGWSTICQLWWKVHSRAGIFLADIISPSFIQASWAHSARGRALLSSWVTTWPAERESRLQTRKTVTSWLGDGKLSQALERCSGELYIFYSRRSWKLQYKREVKKLDCFLKTGEAPLCENSTWGGSWQPAKRAFERAAERKKGAKDACK